MDLDLALLADAATIDASGKLNILGVFDHLSTQTFPAQHPRMALVLRFVAGTGEMGRHAVTISLKDHEGVEVFEVEGEMHLAPAPMNRGGTMRIPHVLYMDGLVFPHAGGYAFDVRVDGEHHVSVPLSVHGPGTSARA